MSRTDDNAARIQQIRTNTATGGGPPNDAEALARLFTDSAIIDDDPSVEARLRSILDATQLRFLGLAIVPGLRTGIEFSDEGFKGDRRSRGAGFRDPWPSSRNQVGHFLTAVGLSHHPVVVREQVFFRAVRDWVDAPSAMSDEEVALRLTIGHEKAPDPDITGTLAAAAAAAGSVGPLPPVVIPNAAIVAAIIASGIFDPFKRQFNEATSADVAAFRAGEQALGPTAVLDLAAAEPFVQAIMSGVDVDHQKGNSLQDLRLSLAGWRLGQWIKQGRFASRADVATWVRVNLKV